ncbi:hypothetical protein COC60_12730 [Bacillus thuringiensis]|nr:hypothetical protein CON12_22415 [Bacillus thuringiensis]PEU90201.1 hypothetical protein CN409_27265 [Bacillus sp. AFS012607]PGM97754.1 hypothetical protein CN959_23600 [Bacillus cereus]PES80023.1 hypothetical protein CN511_21825 [Bacillus thuringiensis]PET90198.1 hypothetical protein CN529_15065 [Bacillus thuringiensis]
MNNIILNRPGFARVGVRKYTLRNIFRLLPEVKGTSYELEGINDEFFIRIIILFILTVRVKQHLFFLYMIISCIQILKIAI